MKISRRKFLASAVAGGAYLSLGGHSGRAAPSDRIRMGVIGVRGRGASHVSTWLKMPDVEVVAICDVDPSVAGEPMKEVETKSGKSPFFCKDIRKLLESKDVHAVSIATTNHWHALASIWAVQAGKDVYVEKPISHNVFEGRVLTQAAETHGRIVAHGTQNRSRKNVRDAIAFLKEGQLGKIRYATGLCYKTRNSIGRKPDGEVPEGVDYDLWLGPAPVRPFNPNRFHYEWHWNFDYGNGDIGNQGAHQMDVARWGLGKDLHPRSVVSLGGRFGYEDDGETPNTQIAVFDYGDVSLVFEVRGLKTETYRNNTIGVAFHAEGGTLMVGNNDVAAFDTKGAVIRRFGGGNDADHFRNFIDAVKARDPKRLTASALEGHLSSALSHLANISHRLGTPASMSQDEPFGKQEAANEAYRRFRDHLAKNGVDVKTAEMRMGRTLALDPAKERFVGDAEADRLLTRNYRKPFVVPDSL